ncbi:FecR family protein [Novosphingobium resinovorum]|uniref:FecR family protein n=1 Tax=Novosphingobium resinovorum TaxID=158500 RepID=UPI002ED4D61A|nr:FecR domain-containing protein [Novosphingobium resinovorum]
MSKGRDISGDMTHRTRANREASDWLILLQEEPDNNELTAQFGLWLNESEVNTAAWAETGRISHVIQVTPPAYAERWQISQSRVVPFADAHARKEARNRRPLRLVGGLSAIAAAACLAVIAVPEMLLRLNADALTGTGEMKSLHLQDGSVVTLAPQSAVAIDVSKGGHRDVRILQGRAWFDVARDPGHPFRVVAADTTTTVLGTAFEVRRGQKQQVSVAVQRGLVSVSCENQAGNAERLGVGDALVLACDGHTRERRTVEPSRIAAWTDGQIVASDRPVKEVIDALRPWHGGVIMTFGNGFDRRRVTGAYDARQSDRVLLALAKSHDMSVRKLTPWITLITAD